MTTTSQKTTSVNALKGLLGYGQSPWLDYIRRSLMTSGELRRLIEEDGLRGVTSNPAIFEKAIVGSTDYQDIIEAPESRGLDAASLYERIAIRDVQDAADTLRRVYDETAGRDGYVSLEVSPLLAEDTNGSVEEARRIWKTVGRPNLMVKVPATAAGIPAISTLIREGINVNVTLLFSVATYGQVADAYMSGLEDRARRGEPIGRIASVASFFVSRIDSAVDDLLAARLKTTTDERSRQRLLGLQGKIAIANAKVAYKRYGELFGADRWKQLADKGAHTQRLLWASTSSKNPRYRDVIYVEQLIGPETVDTIPPATFDAFRDHGVLSASLTSETSAAFQALEDLEQVGISLKEVTDRLLADGLTQFVDAFRRLLDATGRTSPRINQQTFKLSGDLSSAVSASLEDWKANDKVRRMWRGDASLWTGADEGKWLGWLSVTNDQLAHIQHLNSIANEVKTRGYAHALLLGMGGSSLCPEVMRMTFGRVPGWPELHVLDSTDPAQIKAIEQRLDLAKTLVIVSSKSGGTLEPNILEEYFFERVKQVVGDQEVGRRFIAITDPGSKMQQIAESDRFWHVFPGLASIGGRYSALSNFGMVPASVMGVDIPRFLHSTEEMVQACGPTISAEKNPGVVLGTLVGQLAVHGRNKLTFITSPGISDLGAWLEQLVAESTGKQGKGVIPVDREEVGEPSAYGDDRLFAYLRLQSAPDSAQDTAVDALERAGHPVVRMSIADVYCLGEEFFRWEIATAVAGSIIGINPFDQPDVEASKLATIALTSEYERTGRLPVEKPFFVSEGIQLYADAHNTEALQKAAGSDSTLVGFLRAHLNRIAPGDYFATLAYIQMNQAHEQSLQAMRREVRNAKRVATCLGFGPRFLHSTGQIYKGGPNSGVFLQITSDDATDLKVPSRKYTFGVVKAAQARGDLRVLADRGRRALRVHLGADVLGGLNTLASAVRRALG